MIYDTSHKRESNYVSVNTLIKPPKKRYSYQFPPQTATEQITQAPGTGSPLATISQQHEGNNNLSQSEGKAKEGITESIDGNEDSVFFKIARIISDNAVRYDGTDFTKTLPGSIVKDTQCIVLEEKDNYVRVLDYKGIWDVGASNPGWWTPKSNIEVISGRFNVNDIVSLKDIDDKVRVLFKAYYLSKKETKITVGEIQSTGAIIGLIKKAKTEIFNDKGELITGIEQNTTNLPVIILDEKLIPGKPAKSLLRVFPLNETKETEWWVSRGDISQDLKSKSQLGYAVENGELILRMEQIDAQNVRYKITPLAAKKLSDRFRNKIDERLKGKNFTDKQLNLIQAAKEFIENPIEPKGYLPLDFTKVKEEDGKKLNEDLMKRIIFFHKFLIYTGLINKSWVSIKSGIRANSVAHELSTKWTLYEGKGILDNTKKYDTGKLRLLFAKRLVSLNGNQDVAGIQWLPAENTTKLKIAVDFIDKPDDKTLQTKLIKESSKESKKKDEPIKKGQEKETALGFAKQKIDEAIKYCRSIITKVGRNKGKQSAEAAEGYPRNDARRYPNVDEMGISNHCGGEAMDIYFPFNIYNLDPIIDALAMYFGLWRPAKDTDSKEHWHYERIGISSEGQKEGTP